MSDIDKNFEKVVKEINDKIKEAAKAMKEANKLAKKAGFKYLTFCGDDDYNEDLEEVFDLIDINPLFDELDKAGWQTSSIGC